MPDAEPQPALYTAAEVRALDRAAIDGAGIPGIVLMSRAGRAVFDLVRARYPGALPIHVVCGAGNNGGDGFVVARLAADRGLPVTVSLVGEQARITGDARLALEAALAAGVALQPFAPGTRLDAGVIVDALLGTGLGGPVREAHAAAIAAMNASGLPVVAVDIPSGLCSDTGCVRGVAVRAAHTVTFIGRKRGLFTAAARDHCGELHFDSLGVQIRSQPSLRIKTFSKEWIVDHAERKLTSLKKPNRYCRKGNASRKIRRPINRINHPKPLAASPTQPLLLTKNGHSGLGAKKLADDFLRRLVRGRHQASLS